MVATKMKPDTWRFYALIVLVLLALALPGCISGGDWTPTPDLTVNDQNRADTIQMVEDAWATRDAR